MEHLAHPDRGERRGHEVEATGGDAARKDEHIVGLYEHAQPGRERAELIGQMLIRDALETLAAQGGDDAVGVRAAYLVRQDRFAGLDEFVAGRYDADGCSDRW